MTEIDKSQKLEELRRLVNKFRNNISQFTDKNYKEYRLRQDFVNEFFELLDWDMSNKAGLMENLREVVMEDNLEVSGTQKYPDYTFKWGDHAFFFVETKKPSIDIKNDIDPAFQVRRYGYSAKLKISILTDFQELAIYDTRIKPNKNDKAITARLKYFTYDQYEENWDYIYGLLAKGNVISGSIEKEIGSGTKKGTSEVDKDFLELIEEWRSELAKSIAKNNKKADLDSINMAVQKIIDRIIFLRICEEKGIEQYENLLNICENEKNIYEQLAAYFAKANKKYNSELFNPDSFVNELKIDSEVLTDIINGLYYPCPYAFSVLPFEILGNIYEQFLGKTIHLTETHQARIEEKPEVRKAGGVYYTPKYIVDYIVENTVGEKINGLTSKEIQKIKILDPACGSGSFLLGAYTSLLNYHLAHYTKKENLAKALKSEVIYPSKKNSYKLTIKEKQKILLNNIFGVDIDAQAVEVTKLSLMLKLLEGESDESAGKLFKYSDMKLLPTLSNNIKCGNSLVGSDFYKGGNISLFDDRELKKKINDFDWQKEFQEIFKAGGFDCVIGNPPWGADFSLEIQRYIQSKYDIPKTSSPESYTVFMEAAIKLLKTKGYLGYIIPDTFMRKDNYYEVRRFVLNNTTINEIVETGPVFSQVRDTWCAVIWLRKEKPAKDHYISHKQISRFIVSAEDRLQKFGANQWDKVGEVKQLTWMQKPEMVFGYLVTEKEQSLIGKIENNSNRLGDLKDIYSISRGEEGSKFAIKQENKGDFLMIIPADIEKYHCDRGVNIKSSTLTPNKIKAYYSHPKIWITRIQKMRWEQRIVSSYDERINTAAMKTLQVVVSTNDNRNQLKILQAILASRIVNFFCVNYLADDMNQTYLEKLPIPKKVNSSNSTNNYEQIIVLVDQMIETQKKAHFVKSESDKNHFQQKVVILDKQIDDLVYDLYGLTKEEIKVVEGEK